MDKNEASKLKALSDIASIDITLEFNSILQNMLKITCEAMNAHSGTIMLINEKDNEFRMVASYGVPDDYIERVYDAAKRAGVSLTSSPSGTVLKTGKYYLVPDVSKEPRSKPWVNLSKEVGFSSQIFTPMKRDSKVIGLLNVYMAKPHRFAEDEINFVTIAASQAASVVQNARMCSRLRGSIQELKEYKEHLEDEINETHKRLNDSENYLWNIVHSSLDGIAVVDEQGKIEFGNEVFFKIVGWPKDELIGQSFIKMLTSDVKGLYLKKWQEIQNSIAGTAKIGEAKIMTKKGEIRYVYKLRFEMFINGERKFIFIAKDISEKKKLESNLKESEAKYRDLFENANDSIYIYDYEGYFKEVNNTAAKLLRCTKEDLIGTHISEWITPESFKNTQELLKKQTAGEHIEEPIVVEAISKRGEHQWMEIKRRLIKEGDRLIEVHGIGRDITEKRKLEQELIDSEARYRDLFENADDPMFTVDTGYCFVGLNHAGLKALGCTKEEVIGTHISRWLTPESFKIAQDNIRKRLQGEPAERPTALELVCKNGEHRWFELKSRVLKYGGRIAGLHGIARDVTEKRRLEQKLKEYHEQLERSYEELKEAETRYRDLFENADDPMYTLDTGGYFQTINNAGLKILGCTREEVIGTHMSSWLTPESLKISLEVLRKQISGEPIENPVIIEVICKNREHKWGEVRTRYLKEGDTITGVHGIARDITDKKKLEQKLKEYHEKLKKSYEELIEADRIKTEFVSNVTHELLTPLTSIKGFAELLYDGTTGKINDDQKKNLEIILRNSERLTRHIKGLLDVAQLEKNQFGLQFGLISICDILSKAAQDIAPQAKDKEITVTLDTKPLPQIWGDEERLTQVITNLLVNAIKFTPQKGTVTLTTAESTNEVKISITDTGIGIPADKLPRIFERFYQIDGSTSRKYGGIGLGLSICKSIVESHYGSIWAESNGNGSTFNIVLPKLAFDRKSGS